MDFHQTRRWGGQEVVDEEGQVVVGNKTGLFSSKFMNAIFQKLQQRRQHRDRSQEGRCNADNRKLACGI